MEYAAAIWDPYHHSDILQLEKVQHRAARWVLNGFDRYSSVTAMLQQLSWPTLKSRRKMFSLQILFKIIHHNYSLLIPPYYLPTVRSTRQYHPRRFILPNSNTVLYQPSFILDQYTTGTIYLLIWLTVMTLTDLWSIIIIYSCKLVT